MLCPSFSYGFNETFLRSIGVSEEEYKSGLWKGNSSEGEREIFTRATFGIEAGRETTCVERFINIITISVVMEINVKFTTGEKKEFRADSIKRITTFDVFMTNLGRCYEIQMEFSGQVFSYE